MKCSNVSHQYWIIGKCFRFHGHKFPVIALRGPPAPFPVPQSQWPLQQFLKWSPSISLQGTAHITELFGREPYLGVHLRNGEDWTKACDLLKDDRHGLKNLMASSQCIGESPAAPITMGQCFPAKETVLTSIMDVIKERDLKNVYLATDNDAYLTDLHTALPTVNFVHLNPDLTQIDLFILGESEIFIGNCVSSFSSFVRRQRDVAGKLTLYFGMPLRRRHQELWSPF